MEPVGNGMLPEFLAVNSKATYVCYIIVYDKVVQSGDMLPLILNAGIDSTVAKTLDMTYPAELRLYISSEEDIVITTLLKCSLKLTTSLYPPTRNISTGMRKKLHSKLNILHSGQSRNKFPAFTSFCWSQRLKRRLVSCLTMFFFITTMRMNDYGRRYKSRIPRREKEVFIQG